MKEEVDAGRGLVTGLQVIAIYVTDLARARGFYEGILGFQESGTMPPGVVLASGDVTLYLEPGRKPREDDPATRPVVAPVFAAASVLAVRDRLRDAGVPMLGDLQHPGPEFAFFQCLDPDGNVIEFAGTP